MAGWKVDVGPHMREGLITATGAARGAAAPRRREATTLSLGRHALFFDLDGTLLDIAETPDGVAAPPSLIADLASLIEFAGGAVAVLTGRSLDAADALLSPLRLPAAGVHGLELRRSSDLSPFRWARLPAGVWNAVRALADSEPRLRIEDKGSAVAVHYRQAPELAGRVAAAARTITDTFGDTIVCQPGKMVVELRVAGVDKGDALRAFMEEPQFAGRMPVMFGDDLTDEPALAASQALGGLGVRVGTVPRLDVADFDLATPADVRSIVAALAATGAATLG
jgi:trehalose 6-phosphate phosphatase